jgi:hypothetical protein
MDDTRHQGRIGQIMDRIEAWTERHAAHIEAGEAGCGCDLYNDVIHWLPEFDPLDPPNLGLALIPRYVLLDGTVIDGTACRDGRPDWRIIHPARP